MAFIGDLTNVLSNAAGVMSPIGTIAGGVSALGSLFGSGDDGRKLAELQHQWDVEENEKNRQFQRDEWSRQFDLVNAYNNPAQAKARLAKAGLNASAILGGQGSAIGQSSASPSAPSGASGLNPMPDLVSQIGFQSKESVMRRLSILGELGKNSALLPQTKAKLSAEVEDLLSDARFKDIRSDAEQFSLELDKIFKPIMNKVGVKKALADLALVDAETRLAVKNGEKIDEEKLNLAEERLLTIAKRELSEKDREKVEIELRWLNAEKRQALAESKSRESANFASANESNANAAQIKFWNDLNNRPDVKHELVRAAKEQGKAAVNANAISEKQAKQLEYLVEQSAYANDMKEFTYWSNQVSSWVESVGNAASQFYGAGALRELIKLRQGQQVPPTAIRGFGN